jgi:hypothetical protein
VLGGALVLGSLVTSSADAARSALTYERTIGLPGAADMYPSGVDVDPSGTVYVADTGNEVVSAYDASGLLRWTVGNRGTKALGRSAIRATSISGPTDGSSCPTGTCASIR